MRFREIMNEIKMYGVVIKMYIYVCIYDYNKYVYKY